MDAVDVALGDVDKLRKVLKKSAAAQVRAADERALAKATALAWFKAHRDHIVVLANPNTLEAIDRLYKSVLESSERACSRSTYDQALKSLRAALITMRSDGLSQSKTRISTPDVPPEFSALIGDAKMQTILADRWRECINCIGAEAP